MKWLKTVCFILLAVVTVPSWSATKFVNKSATGSNNGSSWANAWTNVSSIGWSGLAAGVTPDRLTPERVAHPATPSPSDVPPLEIRRADQAQQDGTRPTMPR
jgi:hypothetical protein